MQRKNNLLMPLKPTARNIFRGTYHNKNGFAMIMAIIVIIVISTIMALSLSLTAQTSKRTTDIYLHEQVILYSKSAAELALLDIAESAPCTVTNRTYPFDSNLYIADVKLRYVYRNAATCPDPADNYFTIATDEQNGSVLMDITVTTIAGTEPIRYFRRSIQKL